MRMIKLFILILVVCSCKNKVQTEKNNKISEIVPVNHKKNFHLDFNDFLLYVDADNEDFKVVSKDDTIFVQKVLYTTLKNAVLRPKKQISSINVNEKLVIGFKQYTIDDNPAAVLDIYINDEVKADFEKEYTLLSIEDRRDWNKNIHFDEIKNKSLKFQKSFFEKLLTDKEKYIKCCPEYIKQAEYFLDNIKHLKTIDDLKFFPFVRKRVINLDYLKNSQKRKLVVVYSGINY